jgi:hypothetical protein
MDDGLLKHVYVKDNLTGVFSKNTVRGYNALTLTCLYGFITTISDTT